MNSNKPNRDRGLFSVNGVPRVLLPAVLLFCAATASAQLAVTVSPVKVTGQKIIVPLALKNNFAENIESARAVVFLLDEQGKAQGQPVTRWVIGGGNANALFPGATNAFHFVVTNTAQLQHAYDFLQTGLTIGAMDDPANFQFCMNGLAQNSIQGGSVNSVPFSAQATIPPVGLSPNLYTVRQDGRHLRAGELSSADAEMIQRAAWQAVQNTTQPK